MFNVFPACSHLSTPRTENDHASRSRAHQTSNLAACIGVRERKNAFGQKAKFAFEERVRASCEPSFLLMPMPSVPDFSWYKIFTRLLPHLVQTFGTTFVLPTRLYGTNFFLVQFFWYNFFFWYKNVRVRVRPQEPDLRSVNAFGHFPFAFADTYGCSCSHQFLKMKKGTVQYSRPIRV